MTSALSKSGKPSSRLWSVLAFGLVAQATFYLEGGLTADDIWRIVPYAVLCPLAAWLWIGHTMNCLRDLRFSRLSVLLILLPFASSEWFRYRNWLIESLVAFTVALTVQLVIAMMAPSEDSGHTITAFPGGPPA